MPKPFRSSPQPFYFQSPTFTTNETQSIGIEIHALLKLSCILPLKANKPVPTKNLFRLITDPRHLNPLWDVPKFVYEGMDEETDFT